MTGEGTGFNPEEVLQTEGEFRGTESDPDLAHTRAEAERRYTDPSISDKIAQYVNLTFAILSGGGMEDAFPGQDIEGDAAVSEEIRNRALAFAAQNEVPEADRERFADDAVKEFEKRKAELTIE